MPQKKYLSVFLIFSAFFLFLSAPLYAEIIPHSDSEARILFLQNLPNMNLSIIENPDHTKIDSVFWRVDKLGNTYYKVYDNIVDRYGILQINLETKEHNLFYAGNYGAPEKIKNSCSIAHFDVSDDGLFLFLELFIFEKINQIVCVNLKNQTYEVLLEQKPVAWNISSLVYSNTRNQLYYYTFPQEQKINNQNVYYDIGLYTFPKINGKFAAENVQRYFNLPEWVIYDAQKAFIKNGRRDYKGFLDWIYYFADKDSHIFCNQLKDGQILTGEEALKYSIEEGLFNNNNIYLQKSVRKVKDGKITNESSLSTVNNSRWLFPLTDQGIKVYWLLKTDDGIWFIRECDIQKKYPDGSQKYKNEYYTAKLIENTNGDFTENYTSMSDVKIKAACDDTLSTIQTAYGALIYKDYTTDKWNIYKNTERIECINYEEAISLAKNSLKIENKKIEAEPSHKDISQKDDESNPQEAEAKVVSDKSPKEEIPAQEKIEAKVVGDNSQNEDAPAQEEADTKEEKLSTEDESSPQPAPASSSKSTLTIIFFIILIFLCLSELVAFFIVLSKKFNQHLSIKDKRFIFKIQEEERTKLSRDIHDSVVQNIRAIRLEAEMLKVDQEEELKKQRIIEDMTNIIALLRNICYNFHPAELSVQTDNTELISIIDTLCQQFISRTKIPCNIQIQKDFLPPRMDTEKSTNIVRVIQEALANIEKHSYATNVQILITSESDNDKEDGTSKQNQNRKSLVIFVIDDGIGCEINKLGKGKLNFGIRNMRERIAAIGGEIEFFSTPNEGLSVQLRIPYEEEL